MTATPRPANAAATPSPVRHRPRENWRSPFEMLHHIRRDQLYIWPARTYRDLVFETEIPLTRQPVFFISDPDALKIILTRNERFPKSDTQNRLLRKGLGDGLLTAEGETWRGQRRAIQPAFKIALLRNLVPAMAAAIDATAEKLDRLSEGAEFDLHHEMMLLTLDVLRRAMFERVAVDNEKMGWAVSEYLATFGQVDLGDYFALPDWLPRTKHFRVRAASAYFDKAVASILDERRADPAPPNDLLQLMMEARDEATGERLTDVEIRDNLITFFLAGHETTAIGLSWAFYLLALHPYIERRLVDEVRAGIGDRPIGADDLDAIAYARQVFEEAMRLYPPVPMFNRVAAGDENVGVLKIPKGAHIFISPYVLHRHRRLWDRPNDFDPDRFSPEAAAARHRFQYLPFNAGPRACVGLNFALMEGAMAIAALARRFRFALAPGFTPEMEARVTLRPKGGMRMVIQRR
ncbi:MAG: cytochrome P450 [Alphaproteobacteria bacterium]|nr:cytochrome P450 [Alphaproteobacteria bacterium]